MHCHELVEVAAIVAVNARELLARGPIASHHVVQYWTASRIRLDCWSLALKDYLQLQIGSTPQISAAGPLVVAWRTVRPVLEEILASEILTRVWTGVVCLSETQAVLAPIVRRVYVGHLEALNRALNVLVYGRGFSSQEAAELNVMRRRCERWSDLLLAYVLQAEPASSTPVREFAFEADRVREFARDLGEDHKDPASLSNQLLQSSLQAAFKVCREQHTPHPALNQRIAEAVLGALPAELRPSDIAEPPRWLERIAQVTAEAEGMIEELLAIEGIAR